MYVHLPFCVVKCGYCDFHSLAGVPEDEMALVVDAILVELEHKRSLLPGNGQAYTVFLGGGTPTHLPTRLLSRLLSGLATQLPIEELAEFTSEANPESLSQEKLDVLSEHGVGRLSVGVQSFDEERLRFLDRPHDVAGARAALERVLEDGRFQLSLDLIYGLPGQRLEDWEQELRTGLAFGTGHLSAYHLSFEAGTQLEARRARGEVEEQAPETQRAFFERSHDLMAEAGRPAYEISNFAEPGRECLHNLQYWHAGEYLGLGPGASEHIAGRRSRNWKALGRYCQEVHRSGRADAEQEQLSPDSRFREAVWLGLRLAVGLDLEELERRFGVRPELDEPLSRCRSCGWLVEEGSRIRIPREAWGYADGIAQLFL